MTQCIQVLNVNQALSEALRSMAYSGKLRDSRNGPVLVLPEPVVTTYRDSTARVLFAPLRDANPFFHLMEALWMLAGRSDAAWISQFNKRMKDYAEEDGNLHGAYGARWRTHFGMDQLRRTIELLQNDPTTRRAVMAMWSPYDDLGANKRDLPCNTTIYFDAQDSKVLDMTVCCRSNDVWWGVYGSNVVHFSILHEVVAALAGLSVGVYNQLSNNFHLYTDIVLPGMVTPEQRLDQLMKLSEDARDCDQYTMPVLGMTKGRVQNTTPLRRVPFISAEGLTYLDNDLTTFFEKETEDHIYYNEFFNEVAAPMLIAWRAYKKRDYDLADQLASHIVAQDWALACTDWLGRRRVARTAAAVRA